MWYLVEIRVIYFFKVITRFSRVDFAISSNVEAHRRVTSKTQQLKTHLFNLESFTNNVDNILSPK